MNAESGVFGQDILGGHNNTSTCLRNYLGIEKPELCNEILISDLRISDSIVVTGFTDCQYAAHVLYQELVNLS